MLVSFVATIYFAVVASAAALPNVRRATTCDRQCLTNIVSTFLLSIDSNDPYNLPLADIYKATENSHPAALGMMTTWRTITKVGQPSLLAIDVTNQTMYFAVDVSEGNDAVQNILRCRLAVVDEKITEIELFINRWRGDHGFSFSAAELPANYKVLMNPPANRTKPTRQKLFDLGYALFSPAVGYPVNVSDTCQFTELGWKVVDPGTNGNGSTVPLGCNWRDPHPYDTKARTGLVIDEELGFVVCSAIIPGVVEPYGNISAFIPDALPEAQVAQAEWVKLVKGEMPLPAPLPAAGDTMEVLQFYDGQLQAMQINLYLNPPNSTSPWVT